MSVDSELDAAIGELHLTDVFKKYGAGSRYDSTHTGKAEIHIRNAKGTPPPPVGGLLAFKPPPGYVGGDPRDPNNFPGFVVVDLTDANKGSALTNGGGRDVFFKSAGLSSGGSIPVEGWRHVMGIAGEVNYGGINNTCFIPRGISGVFHLEGWHIYGTGIGDAIAGRWDVKEIHVVACRIEVNAQSGFHGDCFQTQELRTDLLAFDHCTFKTNYQGWFISNETSTNPSGRANVLQLKGYNCDFDGPSSTFMWKTLDPLHPSTDVLGPWELINVWIPDVDFGMHVWPKTVFSRWDSASVAGSSKYGCFVRQDATGKYLEFSTPADVVPVGANAGLAAGDCRISGKVRAGKPGEFAPITNVGKTYQPLMYK